MTFNQYKRFIHADLYRATGGRTGIGVFFHELFLGEGWVYIFWMRTCAFTRCPHSPSIVYCLTSKVLLLPLHLIARFVLRRCMFKYGIMIPYGTKIGSGFYIGHFGNIIINGHSQIGQNCNISPGVTIGQANRGSGKGYPTIGDNVYVGSGAKIIGNVKIGNYAVIGANAVVTHDVPDSAVVAGVPAKVISYEGSAGYVEHTDY